MHLRLRLALAFLALPVALAACRAPLSLTVRSAGNATLEARLAPDFVAALQRRPLLALDVPPVTADLVYAVGLAVLDLDAPDPNAVVATTSLTQANLARPIRFGNLRAYGRYRIRATACTDEWGLRWIHAGGPSCDTDVTMGDDDAVTLATINLKLADAQPLHVATVTGDGTAGTSPQDEATTARLSAPRGLAALGDATVIADSGSHQIRLLSPNGVLTTLAGDGTAGSADGDFATARFNAPRGVAVKDNVIYVADTGNHRIRALNLETRQVTTLAGSSAGLVEGQGTAAQFDTPSGVTADTNRARLFVADTNNHRIRAIDLQPGATFATVSTYAGSTQGFTAGTTAPTATKFNAPRGLFHYYFGLYVADTGNNRIRLVYDETYGVPGYTTLMAGDGTAGYQDAGVGAAAAARFNAPEGVFVGLGRVTYIADTGNHRIRKLYLSGAVTTLAGDGTSGYADGAGASARFSGPVGVLELLSSTLFVADTGNNRLRRID